MENGLIEPEDRDAETSGSGDRDDSEWFEGEQKGNPGPETKKVNGVAYRGTRVEHEGGRE